MTNEQLAHLRKVLDASAMPTLDDAASEPECGSRVEDVHTLPEVSLGTLLRVCADYGPAA